MTWICDLVNFGLVYHFETFHEAVAYGKQSGFQYIVYEAKP